MGLNFRKSVSIGKYFRLNFSKSGVGFSVGRKGIRYTKSATGASRATLSLPGTGLSYSVPLGKKSKNEKKTAREKRAEKKTAAALPQVRETDALPAQAAPVVPAVPIVPAAPAVQPVGVFHASGASADVVPTQNAEAEIAAPAELTGEQPAAERIVYFSATGKCYHFLPACSGHSLPCSSTESEAVGAGKTPCSKCRM